MGIGLTLANSDGIARVHGMSNVQAEELVEYVGQHGTSQAITDGLSGSPPVSRACA